MLRLVRGLALMLALVIAVSLAWLSLDTGPVHMSWRLPPEPEFFPGVVRFPEGEQVALAAAQLEAVWQEGESYVLPMSALGKWGYPVVRYAARDVPQSFQVEWLNPWEGSWHKLEDVPPDLVEAHIDEDRDDPEQLHIDFGPPGGAEFEPGMFRGVWFRITPREAGEFQFTLAGYRLDEDGRADPTQRVTPEMTASIRVEGGN